MLSVLLSLLLNLRRMARSHLRSAQVQRYATNAGAHRAGLRDRLTRRTPLWVWLSRVWTNWRTALFIVNRTVLAFTALFPCSCLEEPAADRSPPCPRCARAIRTISRANQLGVLPGSSELLKLCLLTPGRPSRNTWSALGAPVPNVQRSWRITRTGDGRGFLVGRRDVPLAVRSVILARRRGGQCCCARASAAA